jgi:type II secretory pathway pseudopilin PulG
MVVIVIGILATLAIPQYATFAERARAAEAISTISALKTAQSLYKLDNSSYAGNIDDLEKNTIKIPISKFWQRPSVSSTAEGFTVEVARIGTGKKIVLRYSEVAGDDFQSGTDEEYKGAVPK